MAKIIFFGTLLLLFSASGLADQTVLHNFQSQYCNQLWDTADVSVFIVDKEIGMAEQLARLRSDCVSADSFKALQAWNTQSRDLCKKTCSSALTKQGTTNGGASANQMCMDFCASQFKLTNELAKAFNAGTNTCQSGGQTKSSATAR